MSNDRTFYSEHKRLTVHLYKVDSNGKPSGKLKVNFIPSGKSSFYEAKAANQSDLGVDEKNLLRNHKYYGVYFFNSEDWLSRSMTKLPEVAQGALKQSLEEKAAENKALVEETERLKEQIAALQKAPRPKKDSE